MGTRFISGERTILSKLDIFIRKYYKNAILKGGILFLTLLIAGFLLVVLSEYIFHFGQIVRSILFFLFIFCSGLLLVWFLCIPALKLLKIGETLTYPQAAKIIGDHFPEIEDKLLNTLQLIEQKKNLKEDVDLIIASIDQKIEGLSTYKFTRIISFWKNKKYIKYAIPPVVILVFIAILSPTIISEPTSRIVKFSENFTEPLPYQIIILNEKLTALQQEDFNLQIKLLGNEIPNEIFIKSNGNTFKLNKENPRLFTYLFKSLQTNTKFRIIAGKSITNEYEILVYPRPIIFDFTVTVTYPSYTNKESMVIENSGDLTIPEGTIVTWKIFTKDVEKIEMVSGNQRSLLSRENNVFSISKKILEPDKYTIVPGNQYTSRSDSLTYRIEVINDGFPTISVSEIRDSINISGIFFEGIIKDDYGFSKLVFHYESEVKENITNHPGKEILIPVVKNLNNQMFYYSTDLSKLLSSPGSGISYYFEIWDNDEIHGPKSAKSEIRIIKIPTADEISDQVDNNVSDIKSSFENSIKESESMTRNLEDLKRKLVDQNELKWLEKQKIESQLKNLEKVSRQIEEIKKKNEENIRNEEELLKTSERIVEKQKKLSEMMDQLLTEDLKKMIDELRELLKEANREKMEEMLDKIKTSNQNIEEQLDKNLALFKQIEFDRKLTEQIDNLKSLAGKQEELSKMTEKNDKTQEQLMKSQDSINQKFDTISKALEDLSKPENTPETPVDLKSTEPEQEEIQKSLDEIKKDLNDGKNRGAAKNQKSTAKSMNNLASNLQNMQNESGSEQMEEDANNVRNILENLIRLSFQQENVINKTNLTKRNDPGYIQIIKEQVEIRERLKVSEDSLKEIARRQLAIRPIILKEIGKIEQNLDESEKLLTNRSIMEALAKEQFIMTSMNNLALLLNEALDQMKMEMNAMSGQGQSSCKKPSSKGGKMKMKGMKEMQDQLGKELEKMKNSMEKMKSQGNGQKQEQGQFNKELAKMAAQQEAIRNELQKYKEKLLEEGNAGGIKEGENINQTINEMEKIEREIINKQINRETIKRQERILTRMLESEKAEQQREMEEKRESTEAKNQNFSNPGEEFKYKQQKHQATEILNVKPLPINYFYRGKINSYILTIEK